MGILSVFSSLDAIALKFHPTRVERPQEVLSVLFTHCSLLLYRFFPGLEQVQVNPASPFSFAPVIFSWTVYLGD